jgi:GntR family transcriptional repressor for pyruvate dehydrogenase complex
LRPVKTKKIAEEVLERLSGLIKEGIWQPGERLPPERQLAEMLGVGRSSIREAAKSLEFMGLVEARHGEGTFVSEDLSGAMGKAIVRAMALSQRDISDLIEARQVIESHLARLAARRIKASELAQLREHLEKMEENLDQPEQFRKADLDFHVSLATAAHNRILLRIFLTIRELLEQLIGQALTTPGTSVSATHAHARILAALERKNAQEADEAMNAHLEDVRHRLTGILESE